MFFISDCSMDDGDTRHRGLTASVVEEHTLRSPDASGEWYLRKYLSSLRSCPPEALDMEAVDEIRSILMTEVDDDELFFSVSQQDLYFRLSDEFRRCYITPADQDPDERRVGHRAGLTSPIVPVAPCNSSAKRSRQSCSSLESPRPNPEGISCTETANHDGPDNLEGRTSGPEHLPLKNTNTFALTNEEKYLLMTLLANLPRHPPPPYPGAARAKEETNATPSKPRRTLASCLFSIDRRTADCTHTTERRHHMLTASREHASLLCDKAMVSSQQYPTRTMSGRQNPAQVVAEGEDRAVSSKLGKREERSHGACHVCTEGQVHVTSKRQCDADRKQTKEKKHHRDHDRVKHDYRSQGMDHAGHGVGRRERRTQDDKKKSLRSKKHLHPVRSVKNYGIV